MSTVSTGTGYKDPELTSDLSDAEIAEKLRSTYKQKEVSKKGFPTEYVELPSRGLIYPEDHPLASGKIEMRYMTARDEDILTSQNLIKQGVVLDKLFEALIVTPINYNDLYAGDKNAVMVAARLLSYGKDYTVEIDDPFDSGTKQKMTIDLTQIEHKEVDFTLFANRLNEFEFTLPQTKRVVTFQLPTHGIEQNIRAELKTMVKASNKDGINREFTTRLKHVIIAVDGTRGRSEINTFVDNELFAIDSRALRTYMKEIAPDLDLTCTFTSNATQETKEIDIPLDVSFFWPGV